MSVAKKSAKEDGHFLIERAGKISAIRAQGAAPFPFRLEATFPGCFKDNGGEMDGTYTEIWSHPAKWRRESQDEFRKFQLGRSLVNRSSRVC